ncbi:hypothetical protein BDQ17DRAFT_1433432 [Cyathus striatus]|nr:hypothetical protein BDQ17DRAFT_1435107 [Cyathus striatus]KAF8990944.1 hypothetical protein BDQ17DRAFT_1433432 [Cyathus striatus]
MSSQTFPEAYALKSNTNITSKCSVFIGLAVSGVLDVEKLESAHRRLVELWPAVGGSLVKCTTPYSFKSGSKVDFKSRSLRKKFQDISIVRIDATLSTLPTYHNIKWTQSDRIFHFDTVNKFPPPKSLFALRVTTLDDATLLGFRFAHHLFDGQACYDVIKAYCDIISGNPIPKLVPPPDITTRLSEYVHGKDDLPLSVSTNHPHLHPRANFKLGIVRLSRYIGGILVKTVLAKVGLSEGEDERMVHVPEDFVLQLREECQRELDEATKTGDLAEGYGLELTKNDVITAWFLKGVYAGYQRSETKAVDLLCSLNYRSFLDPLPEGELYLHNSFYGIRTHYPSVNYLQAASIARIALDIRLTCIRNKQPSVVKSALRFWEQHAKSFVSPSPPDRSLGISFVPIVSHWTTFEYNKLDFCGALKAGSESGKVVYTQPAVAYVLNLTIKPTIIVLKDGKGGYWIRATLLSKGWKGHEELS